MIEIFNNLYSIITNPYKERNEEEKLDYFAVMGISWAMHLIYAFYSIFAVWVGVKAYEYASSTQTISQIVYNSFNLTMQKFAIFSGISEAIFYPIVFHFSYRFWLFLLKFYAQVFNVDDKADGENELTTEEKSEDILNAIYASNIFLLIPIFGKVISFLAQGFYLYKGLLKKLGFNNLQAFLVLLTPLFLSFLFAILVVSYFIFLLSLI